MTVRVVEAQRWLVAGVWDEDGVASLGRDANYLGNGSMKESRLPTVRTTLGL